MRRSETAVWAGLRRVFLILRRDLDFRCRATASDIGTGFLNRQSRTASKWNFRTIGNGLAILGASEGKTRNARFGLQI